VFLFSASKPTAFRPSLPMRCAPGGVSQGLKLMVHESLHSHLFDSFLKPKITVSLNATPCSMVDQYVSGECVTSFFSVQ
jgi:hypothetical protein